MKKTKEYLTLFLTMLKIGLFTFGGGYAMIALLENEFVAKKNWLERDVGPRSYHSQIQFLLEVFSHLTIIVMFK